MEGSAATENVGLALCHQFAPLMVARAPTTNIEPAATSWNLQLGICANPD